MPKSSQWTQSSLMSPWLHCFEFITSLWCNSSASLLILTHIYQKGDILKSIVCLSLTDVVFFFFTYSSSQLLCVHLSESEQNVYIYERVSTNVCALLEQLLSGGQSRQQRAQQQPGSPRKCCSSLLTAMKSNQSLAFSPGLTSAFNYRSQQPQQQHRERLPPLGRSQHVTAQTLGLQAWHEVSRNSWVGPDRLQDDRGWGVCKSEETNRRQNSLLQTQKGKLKTQKRGCMTPLDIFSSLWCNQTYKNESMNGFVSLWSNQIHLSEESY